MDLPSGLTQHTILLCNEKRERGVVIQTLLTKYGFKVVTALSLYDALKFVAQEMPHLVITEAVLGDGDAGNLYDRLKKHEVLNKVPIIVHATRRTKDEAIAIGKRAFAGVFHGTLEPKLFFAKVHEVIKSHAHGSPYFKDVIELGISDGVQIAIDAAVIGRTDEHLIVRSGTEVDPDAILECIPRDPTLAPLSLSLATNLQGNADYFNLFPVSRLVGHGRQWLAGLHNISAELAEEVDAIHKQDSVNLPAETRMHARHPLMNRALSNRNLLARRVLFYEADDRRFEEYSGVLEGYAIQLVRAKTVSQAFQLLKQDIGGIGCVFLSKKPTESELAEFKGVQARLPAAQRPPIIISAGSKPGRSTSEVRYLLRPFGLGVLVETLQASCERASEISTALSRRVATVLTGVPIRLRATAKLIGLDESGGILEVQFPIMRGTRIMIDHPLLRSAWGDDARVQVSAVGPLAAQRSALAVRFEYANTATSKVKVWEQLLKKLKTENEKLAAKQNTAAA